LKNKLEILDYLAAWAEYRRRWLAAWILRSHLLPFICLRRL